jgi:predicted  nucleic acid-binding Zn-ribbon protein
MATKEITQAELDEAWATIQGGGVRLREIQNQQSKLAVEAQALNSRIYEARELLKQVTR